MEAPEDTLEEMRRLSGGSVEKAHPAVNGRVDSLLAGHRIADAALAHLAQSRTIPFVLYCFFAKDVGNCISINYPNIFDYQSLPGALATPSSPPKAGVK